MAAIDNTIDEGEYTVTAIEYKGINQDIINNGFGLAKQINLSTTDTPNSFTASGRVEKASCVVGPLIRRCTTILSIGMFLLLANISFT